MILSYRGILRILILKVYLQHIWWYELWLLSFFFLILSFCPPDHSAPSRRPALALPLGLSSVGTVGGEWRPVFDSWAASTVSGGSCHPSCPLSSRSLTAPPAALSGGPLPGAPSRSACLRGPSSILWRSEGNLFPGGPALVQGRKEDVTTRG